MKPRVCLSAWLALLGLVLSANAQLAKVQDPLIGQKTNVWCWAASGEMEMQYFGYTVQQCAEATSQFGQAAGVDCCTQPTPAACISGGQVWIGHYNFTYQQKGASALSPAEIEDQISVRHEPWIFNPYCADASKCGGWGHVEVGVGYFKTAFAPLFFILVNDPWPPNQGSRYFQLYWSYKDGCWWGNGSCDGYADGYDVYDVVPPKKSLAKVPQPIVWQPKLPPDELRRLFDGDADPRKEAELSWQLMRSVAGEGTAAELGFDSAAAAASARLAAPVEQFDIPLQRLRSWKPGERPQVLLQRAPVMLVPVEAGGHMRASIQLRRQENRWRLAAIGSPQFTAAWERAHAAGGEFLVFVEGLDLAFAGKREGNRLLLTALFSDPAYHVKEGERLPARRVLSDLAEAAANYRGNGATFAGRRPK